MKRNSRSANADPVCAAKAKKHAAKRVLIIAAIVVFAGLAAIAGVNLLVAATGEKYVVTAQEAVQAGDRGCILVLGCGLSNGAPSALLQKRLDRAVELYFLGAAPKLLMSGDNGSIGSDEVSVMRDFALAAGVPAEDIVCDYGGLSTYDSIWRAKYVFEMKKILIVTQHYHLTRALYDAQKFGLEPLGVSAEEVSRRQALRYTREIPARCKAFVWCIIKPQPQYTGAAFPVTDSADAAA